MRIGCVMLYMGRRLFGRARSAPQALITFVFLAAVLAANLVPKAFAGWDIAPVTSRPTGSDQSGGDAARQQQAADQVQPVYDNDASVLKRAGTHDGYFDTGDRAARAVA